MGCSHERIPKEEEAKIMFSDMPMPLFMKDSTWYYFDDETETMRLTETGKKIPEVVASYNEYYGDNDGWFY